VTTNLERRLHEHNYDPRRAGRWCWANRPVDLVWSKAYTTRGEALREEARLKKLTHSEKALLFDDE
jgi:predicted GIY-YIG superfamily endonuclease